MTDMRKNASTVELIVGVFSIITSLIIAAAWISGELNSHSTRISMAEDSIKELIRYKHDPDKFEAALHTLEGKITSCQKVIVNIDWLIQTLNEVKIDLKEMKRTLNDNGKEEK